jgi:hypothetical protein
LAHFEDRRHRDAGADQAGELDALPVVHGQQHPEQPGAAEVDQHDSQVGKPRTARKCLRVSRRAA